MLRESPPRTDTQINDQISVLNRAFSSAGVSFTLAGVDYTNWNTYRAGK